MLASFAATQIAFDYLAVLLPHACVRQHCSGECPSPGTATSIVLTDGNVCQSVALPKPRSSPGMSLPVVLRPHARVCRYCCGRGRPQPELSRRVPVPGHSNVDCSDGRECLP